MDIKNSCAQIIKYIGGVNNVSTLTHCATRLRFALIDDSKADIEKLSSIEGVLTAQQKGGQTQVVIGAKVAKFYAQILEDYDLNSSKKSAVQEANTSEKKGNPINRFLEVISSLFTPILPGLIGCGMIQAILKIVVLMGLSADGPTYQVLNMMGQLVFYFLPILLAVTSAEKFKTDRFLALLLAGGYMYYTINFLANPLSFAGIPFKAVTYTSTVIPIILSVYVLKYVHNFFNKIIPDIVKIVLVPMLTLIVMIPLQLSLLGPIGAYCGTFIAEGIQGLFNLSGLIAGGVLGFFRPILVMFGMHYSIMPIQIQQVADTGSTAMITSALMANIAQAGAAFGVFLKTKNKTMKTAALSATVPAVFGVTEPAIYGITLRYKKPFFVACGCAAVSSAILGGLKTVATSIALPGILALPTYECAAGFIWILALFALTFVASTILTYIIGFEEK